MNTRTKLFLTSLFFLAIALLIAAQIMQPPVLEVIGDQRIAVTLTVDSSASTAAPANLVIEPVGDNGVPCSRQMPGIVEIPGCPPAPAFYATLPPGGSP
ncbi:hypothetical protein HY411_01485 [Candidatus Gottesmanbacteria bacterium]|nr:hypothetical protein [Candidatus Gottesmanbacteria bacterium]